MIEDIFYFDHELVDRLSNQGRDSGLKGTTSERQVSTSNTVSGKGVLGLGSLLAMLGIAKAEGEASAANTRGRMLRKIDVVERTPEATYQSVLDQLVLGQRLLKDLDLAQRAAVAAGGSVFCQISGKFIPAGLVSEDGAWRLIANRNAMLVSSPAAHPSVTMGMSLTKIVGLRRPHIDEISHLAMEVRALGGIPLKVFGRFDGHYIKPIVATHL